MFILIGIAAVVASVAGGYVMAGGHLPALNQPAEFLIIFGAAVGSLVIGTPQRVLKRFLRDAQSLHGTYADKADYLDLLAMMYQLLKISQQGGVMALESHFEEPHRSAILSQYPGFLARPRAIDLLADSVKVIVIGGIGPDELDALMDEDVAVQREEAAEPSIMLAKMADALPGLGIVAAVLGVVITMGAIDGPPAEIGHKVGAALVGTFLGVLLSYGFVQPLATLFDHRANDQAQYLYCIKAAMLASHKGFAPSVAVEFARRVLPSDLRPSFEDTEEVCKAGAHHVGRPEQAAA